MHLTKLHITNFRCFKNFEVEFAPRVTVLFGKNGSGKTTLIHAIHKALSFVFKRNTSLEKGFDLTSGFPELKVEQYIKTDGMRDERTGFLYPYIDIKANATFNNISLEWNMYASTSTFSLQPSKYTKAHEDIIEKVNETNKLPFFAYYSDSFPHIPKPKSITQQQHGLRNLGYLDWNQESACSEIWISRYEKIWKLWNRADRNIKDEESALRNCDTLLQQGVMNKKEYDEDVLLHREKLERAQNEKAKYDEEITGIKSCLIRFSKGDSYYEVTDIFSSPYEEDGLCLEVKQGDHTPFHILPAGYKRLYYLVLDIAYRSYVLNRNTNPSGIVIIDEIDLHLHPELEKVVLGRFMETFPDLQFIVSTHSPLVLTGLETEGKPNRILRMNNRAKRLLRDNDEIEKPVVWPDVYGLDYNTGIEDIMGVSSKNEKLDYLISLCAYLRNNRMNKKAKETRDSILKDFPINEERLETLIIGKQKEQG